MSFLTFFIYYLVSEFIVGILFTVYHYIQQKRFEKQYKDGTLQIVNLLDELDEDKKTWN